MKIRFKKSELDFVSMNSTTVKTEKGLYHFIPYWFKETDDDLVLDRFGLDGDLPDDLVESIEKIRVNQLTHPPNNPNS